MVVRFLGWRRAPPGTVRDAKTGTKRLLICSDAKESWLRANFWRRIVSAFAICLQLLLEDYDVRSVAQAYIAGLKVKSILTPKLGDIKAAKLTTAQVKEYIRDRQKKVKPGTVNRELGMLHRAFQLGYQHDPPLVGRVPHFPKLPEGEPRKGFLKPELYQKALARTAGRSPAAVCDRLPRGTSEGRASANQVDAG